MVNVKVQIDSQLCGALSSEPAFLVGTTEPARILRLIPQLPAPPDTSVLAWTSEHARLLRAMCIGGVTVLGVYAPGGCNTGTTATDIDIAAALARRIFVRSRKMRPNELSGPLVLCIGARKKPAVKLISTEASESPRQIDLRIIQGLSDNIVVLRGLVSLQDVTTEFVKDGIHPETACIETAGTLALHAILAVRGDSKQSIVINSEDDDRSLASLMGWPSSSGSKKKKSSANVHSIQVVNILFPTAQFSSRPNDILDQDSFDSTEKSVALNGVISVFAVAFRDTAAGEALRNVRSDMNRSIRARADISHEMGDSDVRETSEVGWSPLSIRVVAWPPDTIITSKLPMTDYLDDSSTLDEIKSHFAEVLSWSEKDIGSTHFEQTEEFPSKPCDRDSDEKSLSLPKNSKNMPPPIPDTMLRDHDSAGAQILLNGVFLAIALAIVAIIVRQFL